MPTEDTRQFEDALKRQPSWEPPPGFARRVVRLAAVDRQPWAGLAPPERVGLLRAAVLGLAAAAGAYVVGLFLSGLVVSIGQETVTTVDGYASFVELTARAIASRAVLVSWICAALSLALAASTVQRARY